MKKLFVLLFAAAAFAACSDDASAEATPDAEKTENDGGNMNASGDAG